jgi:hypothetical protein
MTRKECGERSGHCLLQRKPYYPTILLKQMSETLKEFNQDNNFS